MKRLIVAPFCFMVVVFFCSESLAGKYLGICYYRNMLVTNEVSVTVTSAAVGNWVGCTTIKDNKITDYDAQKIIRAGLVTFTVKKADKWLVMVWQRKVVDKKHSLGYVMGGLLESTGKLSIYDGYTR